MLFLCSEPVNFSTFFLIQRQMGMTVKMAFLYQLSREQKENRKKWVSKLTFSSKSGSITMSINIISHSPILYFRTIFLSPKTRFLSDLYGISIYRWKVLFKQCRIFETLWHVLIKLDGSNFNTNVMWELRCAEDDDEFSPSIDFTKGKIIVSFAAGWFKKES